MKKPALGSLLLVLSLVAGPVSAQTVSLFSTGVDAAGVPLAGGALDPHYDTDLEGTKARVLNNQTPGPYVQSATSRWVWLDAAGNLDGVRDFTTTFTLTAPQVAAGVTLSGAFASDNIGSVFLNNNDLGILVDNFTVFTSFSATSGFVVGTNVVRFTVNNYSGPGGLNVDNLQYTVGSGGSAAPEPGALAFGLLGGVALIARKRGGKN